MTTTDMRTLGRLGEPLRSTPGFRRRRRIGRPVALVLASITVILGWLGVTANSQLQDDPGIQDLGAATATTLPVRPDAASSSRSAGSAAPVFANVDGLDLALVHHDPVAIGFHEADRADALPLMPVGRLNRNTNATWTPVADSEGPAYSVVDTGESARPATGAVGVVVPQGATVLAPVSGRVTTVTEYPLYGQTRDWRLVISPDGRPDLAVVLRFVSVPVVAIGDEVTAGKTPLGQARVLPFASALDVIADAGLPRVSIQVQPAVASEAIDPNAPAISAQETPGA